MRRARLLAGLVITAVILLSATSLAFALPELPVDAFQSSDNCGCHSAFLETWGRSMHAQALTDPLYRVKLDEANKATDGALGPFCDACHAPVAVMAGLGGDPTAMPPQAAEGVGCDFCHQVTGTTEPIGNVSQEVAGDGVKRAPFDDSNSPAHETAYSAFHESAEFCGACHNVDHPGNGLHLEATYTEWKEGPYAEEGITCQDCHMTPGPGVTKPNPGTAAAGGPQREHVNTMTFAGGNVGLGDSVLAEERLQAACELELVAPEIVAPGETVDIQTTITNVGAGHYVPTGLTEVREMWLEVTATDPEGNSEVVGEHRFGTILADGEGNAPVELWEAEAIASDDRIPPRESVTDAFEYTMPEGGEIELAATLYYRSAPEEMAEKAGVELPTTTMVQSTMGVFGSEEVMAEAGTPDEGGDGGGTNLLFVLVVLIAAAAAIGFLVLRRRGKGGGEGAGAA
jgi:hypothetical protein